MKWSWADRYDTVDDTNHAGDLAPKHSGYFNALTASRPQMGGITTTLQAPPAGPHGTIGVIRPRAASEDALQGATGYFGDAPQKLQGIVKALPPWLRR